MWQSNQVFWHKICFLNCACPPGIEVLSKLVEVWIEDLPFSVRNQWFIWHDNMLGMCIFGVVWDSCWCFVSHVKHIHLYRWIFCKKCSILKFTWPVVSSLVTWNWGWTCASSLFNNGLDSMSHGISISASFWHGLLCLTFQCSWIIVSGWKHPILNLDELSRSLGNNLFLAFWMPMCICLTVLT